MAYTEKRLDRVRIKITDPETGLSVTGPASQRASMQKRLASKIRNEGTVTSDTKLGADLGTGYKKKGTHKVKTTKPDTKKEKGAQELSDMKKESKELKGKKSLKKESTAKAEVYKGKKEPKEPKKTIIDATGDEPKQYKVKKPVVKKPVVKKEEKELTAAQRAKRGLGPKKKREKGIGGGAVMKGYGKDTSEDEGMLDWIKKGYQEWKRDKQPDDEATTGVKEPENIPKRTPTVAQALAPDPEAEKIAGEYEQQFLSDEALREQFDRGERPEAIQAIIDDPSKLTGGQYPAWWSDSWKKKADAKGGVRPEPGESLLEFNKRLEGMELTEEDLKGKISNEDFADQLVTDAQIDDLEGQVFDDKTMTYSDAEEGQDGFKRKSKPLEIGPESGLDQKRVPEIKKIFESKDPEAELIASEYEGLAAIEDARKKQHEGRRIAPEPKPEPKPEPTPEPKPTDPMAQTPWQTSEEQAKAKYSPKPEEVTNKIVDLIDKPGFDHESELPQVQKLTAKLNKEDTAIAKEATGNWYVDPFTGFAIDLNKLQARRDRKDAMEMAALLPADKRAMYLYQEELINKEDVDKLLEPSEKEKLAKKLTEMQISVQASNLLLNNKKLKNYQSPEQKEWHTSYRNAITNDDIGGIYTFGRKLKLSEHELQKIVEGHKKAGLAKATKKDTDIFKKRFNIPYTKVWDSRQRVMMESAKVFEEGQAGAAMNFMGQRYAGRKGLLEDNGLYEIEGARALGSDELAAYFANLPDQKIFQLPRWQTPEGKPDYAKILNSPTAYQRLLQKNLLWRHMDTLTNGQYQSMEQYRTELQKRDESINQHFVSN